MRVMILLTPVLLLFACTEVNRTCVCINEDTGDRVASYDIATSDKDAASFECGQKQLAFSGNPEFSNVNCNVTEEEK